MLPLTLKTILFGTCVTSCLLVMRDGRTINNAMYRIQFSCVHKALTLMMPWLEKYSIVLHT